MNIHSPSSQTFCAPDFSITLNCRGNNDYTKVSYPVKYGLFSRLETRDHVFEFNLNHEIRHAKSRQSTWLHPSEWLKRTYGNDWVYYSSGGYSGVVEALGEYYLPNLMYPTNSLLGGKPFDEHPVKQIVDDWYRLICQLPRPPLPDRFARWMEAIQQQTPQALQQKARALFDISGSRVTVMPPDARHVDYDIIPLTISDGCLYKCRFCKIKNKKRFAVRSHADIDRQINDLKHLYGRDIVNFNALFLGEHDALNTPFETLVHAVTKACDVFEFKRSHMKKTRVFMFGSVDSFLNADPVFFETFQRLPIQTFINIGLESYDQATLDFLGKPITAQKVKKAFEKMQAINDTTANMEISCNFVMDEALPDSHYAAFLELVRHGIPHTRPKGSVYLSPLKFGSPSRQVLYDFYRLKTQSRLPTFLYLIQRL